MFLVISIERIYSSIDFFIIFKLEIFEKQLWIQKLIFT